MRPAPFFPTSLLRIQRISPRPLTRSGSRAARASLRFAGSSKRCKDKTHLFKTELCKQFFLGTCTYENCTFAHDNSELRPLQKPPNYKTVL